MNRYTLFWLRLLLLLAFAALAGGGSLRAADKPTGSAPGAQTGLGGSAEAGALPQSVFVIPASPAEGRNPFFPSARASLPIVHTTNRTNTVDASGLTLNGITGPPKRTAMINGRTFELGEEADGRLPTGAKLMIKCIDIKNDAATVLFNGQRRELRLRLGA